jgi:alkaline phosphatase
LLTAVGPGSELFRGSIDNTNVFRIISTALGLGQGH